MNHSIKVPAGGTYMHIILVLPNTLCIFQRDDDTAI